MKPFYNTVLYYAHKAFNRGQQTRYCLFNRGQQKKRDELSNMAYKLIGIGMKIQLDPSPEWQRVLSVLPEPKKALKTAKRGRKLSMARWIIEGIAAMQPQSDLRRKNWKPFIRLASVRVERIRRMKDRVSPEGSTRPGVKRNMALKAMKATISRRLRKKNG